jgi:peptide/nickel transport system substrate-binding protein
MKIFRAAATAGLALALMASAADAQKSKDTLRFAVNEPYQSLDPYFYPNNEASFVGRRVIESLIYMDERNGTFVPHIAKAWKRIDDRTLEFEINDDFTFHSGNKLTADDVVYTTTFSADPKVNFPFKNRHTWIKTVEKTGPYTVRIISGEPYADDLMYFAFRSHVLDSKLHGANEDKSEYGRRTPSGTGPYKVTKFDRNTGVTLERYESVKKGPYTRAPIGKLEAVFMPDRQTQIAHMLAGNVDFIADIQPDNAKELANDPRFATTAIDVGTIAWLGLDALGRSGQNEMKDPRVRRAIFMAIDRESVIKGVVPGPEVAVRLSAPCLDSMASCGYTTKPPAYDPAGAKKLLAEAGYPDGFDLRLDTNVNLLKIGEAISGYLRAVGIRASVSPTLISVWQKKRQSGDMPAEIMYGPTTSWPDGGYVMDIVFGLHEVDFVKDDVIRKNMILGNGLRDMAQRKAAYTKAYDRMNELHTHLPISTVPALYAHGRDVRIESLAITPRTVRSSDIFWK